MQEVFTTRIAVDEQHVIAPAADFCCEPKITLSERSLLLHSSLRSEMVVEPIARHVYGHV
ncbi:hypothetical protein KIN20_028399 [Parelaphostrongylus tenuis]|uniref:Uncharacterized protein n=1 Tax=Parelaphostrongylus tenuis TaxID=148309 RepID=A0AAD5R142_PARTN|nr:hypothetical protein KIN20_028399 [Parelaphostrongylus tenuis]